MGFQSKLTLTASDFVSCSLLSILCFLVSPFSSCQAKKLSQKLQEIAPEKHFLVIYDPSKSTTTKGRSLQKSSLGELQVHPGLQHYVNGHVIADWDSAKAEDDSTESDTAVHIEPLGSDRIHYGFLKLISMRAKVALLQSASLDGRLVSPESDGNTRSSRVSLPLLVDAILSDIVDEHSLFRAGAGKLTAGAAAGRLLAGRRKEEKEGWGKRMPCLSALEGAFGEGSMELKKKTRKFDEVFRLVVNLKLIATKSHGVMGMGRVAMIVKILTAAVDRIEASVATLVGEKNAGKLTSSSGQVVAKMVDQTMKDGGFGRGDILSKMRKQHGIGGVNCLTEDGSTNLVISMSEFQQERNFNEMSQAPQIFERFGMPRTVYGTDRERQAALTRILPSLAPNAGGS